MVANPVAAAAGLGFVVVTGYVAGGVLRSAFTTPEPVQSAPSLEEIPLAQQVDIKEYRRAERFVEYENFPPETDPEVAVSMSRLLSRVVDQAHSDHYNAIGETEAARRKAILEYGLDHASPGPSG